MPADQQQMGKMMKILPVVTAAIQPTLTEYHILNVMQAMMVFNMMAGQDPAFPKAIAAIQGAAMSGNLPAAADVAALKAELG